MATVAWSGFWNDVYSGGVPSLADSNNNIRQLSNIFRRPGLRKHQALLNALIGAAAGATATSTYKRVTGVAGIDANGNQVNLGGVRPIETVTVINRATTAGDITAEKAIVNLDHTFTRVADRSGNGAGGKVGY